MIYYAIKENLSYQWWVGAIASGVLGLILFFLLYLSTRIIGNYVYYFKDKDGNFHCHAQAPVYIPELLRYCCQTPAENAAQWNAEEYLVDGAILRIKLGGWFKKSEVLFNRFGYSIRFKNKLVTISSIDLVLSRLTPERALEIVNFTSIEGLIVKALEKRQLEQELEQAQNLQNDLGIAISCMLSMVTLTRNVRQSPHARALREVIESMLAEIDPELVEKWERNLSRTDVQEWVRNGLAEFDRGQELFERWQQEVLGTQEKDGFEPVQAKAADGGSSSLTLT
jgi:hypothetical protein